MIPKVFDGGDISHDDASPSRGGPTSMWLSGKEVGAVPDYMFFLDFDMYYYYQDRPALDVPGANLRCARIVSASKVEVGEVENAAGLRSLIGKNLLVPDTAAFPNLSVVECAESVPRLPAAVSVTLNRAARELDPGSVPRARRLALCSYQFRLRPFENLVYLSLRNCKTTDVPTMPALEKLILKRSPVKAVHGQPRLKTLRVDINMPKGIGPAPALENVMLFGVVKRVRVIEESVNQASHKLLYMVACEGFNEITARGDIRYRDCRHLVRPVSTHGKVKKILK